MYLSRYFSIRLITWLVLCTFLIACRPEQINERKAGMVRYGSMQSEKQQKFIQALDQVGIPYFVEKQTAKSILHHWPSDTAKFYGLKREIQYGKHLRFNVEELILANTLEAKSYYTEAFNLSGIRYRVMRSNGTHPLWSIHYSQIYGLQVDQIHQEWEIFKMKKNNLEVKDHSNSL